MRLQLLSRSFILVGVLALPVLGSAQAPKAASTTGKTPATTPVKTAASGQPWAELTPLQQQALKPLALSWNTSISEAQKRKWLEISKNYPLLPPDGQATMHSRMNEWVSLSPQQRAQARLNFGKSKELSKQLTPEEVKAQWQAYQTLSPEEKQKLSAKASPKPAGAATAVKPVAVKKLAVLPPRADKPGAKPTPKITPAPAVAASNPTAPPSSAAATDRTDPTPQR